MEPPVDDRLVGGGLVVPVAGEHHPAAHQHLAVVGDRHVVARQQLAHRAHPLLADPVDGNRRTGLSQAVTLVHGDPRTAVEVAQPLAQWRTAGHRGAAVAAERGAQLAVDQPIEQSVPGPQQRAWPSVVQRGAPLDRGAHGPVKDPALAAVAGIQFSRVVNFFEHPRYRHHHRRLENPERGHQVLDVAGVADGNPVGERRHGQRARQHVGQRQENKQAFALAQQRRETFRRPARLVHQVGVRQSAALRAARRPRGVDQRSRIGRPQARQPLLEAADLHRPAGLGEDVERLGFAGIEVQGGAQAR